MRDLAYLCKIPHIRPFLAAYLDGAAEREGFEASGAFDLTALATGSALAEVTGLEEWQSH
jgi:hypothetical protein